MEQETKKYKSNEQLSLVSLSIPFIFMSLANFAASIINTLVLALVPGTGIIYSESVGAASKIFNIFTTLCTFIIGGIGVVVSQRIGRKESEENIHKSIYTSLCATTIFAISITILSEIISPFALYGFLKPNTSQYDNALIYVEVIALTILLMAPKNAIGSIINSYGYVKHTIIWNILGIVIDTLFTFLFVLAIDMGILGSAMGTIVANIVTFVYALIIFNKKVLKFNFKHFLLNKPITKELLKISVPIGFEKISYTFAMLIVGIFVAQIGMRIPSFMVQGNGNSETNLLNVSNTIIETFSNVITLTSIAFSQGGAIICSRKMGQKDYQGASEVIRKAFWISIVGDILLALLFFFIQGYLIDFFKITQPGEIKNYFGIIKKVCFIPFTLLIFLQIGRTINIIYLMGPMSYGNLIFNSIFSVINTWVVVIALGFASLYTSNDQWGSPLYGINGIYLLKALDEILRGIFNLWWWKSGKWNREKNIKRKV